MKPSVVSIPKIAVVACGAILSAAGTAWACSATDLPRQFVDAEIKVGVWTDADAIPACLGGLAETPSLVAVLDAHLPAAALTAEDVAERIARVSRYPDIQYWSTTRQRWRQLIPTAHPRAAADGPDLSGDLSADDLVPGRTLYIHQQENTPVGDTVYALDTERRDAAHLALRAVNAAPATRLGITFLAAGDYRLHHRFQRRDDGWRYRGELRMAAVGLPFLGERAESFMTRMVAAYRYMAGRPMTAPPPAALP